MGCGNSATGESNSSGAEGAEGTAGRRSSSRKYSTTDHQRESLNASFQGRNAFHIRKAEDNGGPLVYDYSNGVEERELEKKKEEAAGEDHGEDISQPPPPVRTASSLVPVRSGSVSTNDENEKTTSTQNGGFLMSGDETTLLPPVRTATMVPRNQSGNSNGCGASSPASKGGLNSSRKLGRKNSVASVHSVVTVDSEHCVTASPGGTSTQGAGSSSIVTPVHKAVGASDSGPRDDGVEEESPTTLLGLPPGLAGPHMMQQYGYSSPLNGSNMAQRGEVGNDSMADIGELSASRNTADLIGSPL